MRLKGFKKQRKQMKWFWLDAVNSFVHQLKPRRNELINEKEIRVYGLMRTGNYAIIQWIYYMSPEVKCFLGYADAGKNPYISFKRRPTIRQFQQDFEDRFEIRRERVGLLTKKKTLIFSYEDEYVQNACGAEMERNHDRWVGKSGEVKHVLLLRDPFNFFASRLKKDDTVGENRYNLRIPRERETILDLWKAFAREFVGETSFLPADKIPISYNRWHSDQDYREELAGKLGLKFENEVTDRVLSTGGGSSFDSTNFDQAASQMKVLDRWRHFEDDEFYRSIFKDREIFDLSEKIFGHIPETDKLLS